MRRMRHLGLTLLALSVLLVLGDALFFSRHQVFSTPDQLNDLTAMFADLHRFGAAELRQGRLPLWNPRIYGGAPFLGGMQAGLLYPPNWLHLLLPAGPAFNLLVALHLAGSGLFAWAWAAGRGLRPAGCTACALVWIWGGAHFLQLTPGHLPHLFTLAWAPLLLRAVDGLFDSPGRRWLLLGAAAALMQILAGFPQYAYYTALGTGCYALLRAIETRRAAPLGGLALLYLLAAALGAAQLGAGLDAAHGAARAGGVSRRFAGSFSLPPENLLALVAPDLFVAGGTYWGRWFHWEVTPFLGAAALLLALVGLSRREGRRIEAPLVVLFTLLALGHYTPLFDLLYAGLPGFDRFRGTARFTPLVGLFAGLLAGRGTDALLEGGAPRAARAAALAGLAAGLLALLALPLLSARWPDLLRSIGASGEVELAVSRYADPAFVAATRTSAGRALGLAGASLLAGGLLLLAAARRPRVAWGLALLLLVELLSFARTHRPVCDLRARRPPPEVEQFLALERDAARTHWIDGFHDNAMSGGWHALWGYGPDVGLRWAELVAHTQGVPPAEATEQLAIRRYHPLFRLLRLRHLLSRDKRQSGGTLVLRHGVWRVHRAPGPILPEAFLVDRAVVVSDRDKRLELLADPRFDPRRLVVLETEPDPAPLPLLGPPGGARVVARTSDSLLIEAVLQRPAVLVVPEAWRSGWRIEPLQAAQPRYDLLPANHALRGVPLAAGSHRLRMVYAPLGWRIGCWISAAAWLALLAAVLGWLLRRRGVT